MTNCNGDTWYAHFVGDNGTGDFEHNFLIMVPAKLFDSESRALDVSGLSDHFLSLCKDPDDCLKLEENFVAALEELGFYSVDEGSTFEFMESRDYSREQLEDVKAAIVRKMANAGFTIDFNNEDKFNLWVDIEY